MDSRVCDVITHALNEYRPFANADNPAKIAWDKEGRRALTARDVHCGLNYVDGSRKRLSVRIACTFEKDGGKFYFHTRIPLEHGLTADENLWTVVFISVLRAHFTLADQTTPPDPPAAPG